MVVAKGPQYCVIDGQFIVGKAHLVPVPVEATFELSDDAQKGPCCAKHYKRIFYHSPAKAPTVHTFLGFTNDNNGAGLLIWDLFMEVVSFFCSLCPWNQKRTPCFINTKSSCF